MMPPDRQMRPARVPWRLRGPLVALVLVGAVAYLAQLRDGLGLTDLSREMPWGLYIAQFTFLVGVGASAVTVILPYYVHRQEQLARALVLGEVLAVVAVSMAMTCVLVDLGRPARLLNVLLHPCPSSLMFWDLVTLSVYWALSVVGLGVAWREKGQAKPRWARPLALVTVPWAFAIHIVTALLYAGLAARPGWMTAVLAPRFIATAFASGPALLLLLSSRLARAGVFDIGEEATRRLFTLMTYAAVTSVFLALLEAFTALYSGLPEAEAHLAYQYVGLDGRSGLVPWTYLASELMAASLVVLLVPTLRARPALAELSAAGVFVSVLVEKGFCFIAAGLSPSPLGVVRDYRPSVVELAIVAGIYAAGALAVSELICRLHATTDHARASSPEDAYRPETAAGALPEKPCRAT